MIVSIMQPTYLPWIGYFDLIAKADLFVFLDDVQFARRSWQQRNRILINGKEKLLTIPIHKKGKRDQLIKDVIIDDTQKWRTQHFKTLELAYRNAPYSKRVLELMEQVIFSPIKNLSELNQRIIKALSRELGLKTPFQRSSDLETMGNSSLKLLEICSSLNATKYLSASGSRDYIEKEGFFIQSNILVDYQTFIPTPYKQVGSKCFIPSLSAIDFLCNVKDRKF